MHYLYVEAPFAAFRTFTAGWYRPTATFLTPSAAYGLLLNIAGIESRLREGEDGHDGKTPASLLRPDLPAVRLAVGVPTFRVRGAGRVEKCDQGVDPFPRVQTVYQQLHNYPVGTSGKERAESCRGNKYNITPVRREYLTDVRAVIAWEGDDERWERVERGLRGELNDRRYGVPFLGDNAFLIDRLHLLPSPQPVFWYERITADNAVGTRDRITRLTEQIDRAELSKTRSALFAPDMNATSTDPPPNAWVQIPSKAGHANA